MFPNSEAKKFRPDKLHHPLTSHYCSQKICERCPLDLFDELNPMVPSILLWRCWLWLRKQNRPFSCDFQDSTNFLHHLLTHHHLQSGPCERLFPNFSNMLNPMEASICCSDSWLQSYKQERSKFRQQKISRKLSSPPIDISPAVVRTLWKTISGPFWCVESSSALSLTLWALVVALQAKVFKIFRFLKFRQALFTLSKEHHHL